MAERALKYVQIGNVVLVGTSHIAQESVKNVAAVIEHFSPCIVGIELDRQRFYALLEDHRQRYLPSFQNIRRFGIKGTLFALVASAVSEKLAKMVRARPGDDMRSALQAAKKHQLTIALLDQPLHITLHRFSAAITWKEKWHFLIDVLSGIFFPQRELRRYGLDQFDLRKVPSTEVIKQLLAHVKERYPNVYRVLIDERNRSMVRQIRKFQQKYPHQIILAVIGAGHEEGIKALLERG